MIYLLILVIFHSYVELPAGTFLVFDDEHRATNAFVFLRAATIHDLCYLPTERFFGCPGCFDGQPWMHVSSEFKFKTNQFTHILELYILC